MNYLKIIKSDIANGIGCRVTLWVSGCSIHCTGCHNSQSWDKHSGKLYTPETHKQLLKLLDKPYINGLTLTGGHPLEDYNYNTVKDIVKQVKHNLPEKTIWLYTGLKWEDISSLDIWKYIDIVVDGAYEQDKRDITLAFRGSKNQRIIDVKQSLKNHKIILWRNDR